MQKQQNLNDTNNKEFSGFDDVSEYLTCRICFEILFDHIKCSGCEYSSCFECLQKWSEIKGEEMSCTSRCENSFLIRNCKLTLTQLGKLDKKLKCRR